MRATCTSSCARRSTPLPFTSYHLAFGFRCRCPNDFKSRWASAAGTPTSISPGSTTSSGTPSVCSRIRTTNRRDRCFFLKMGIGQMPFTRRCHETRVAREFDRLTLVFVTSLCAFTGTSRFTQTFINSLVRYPGVGSKGRS